MAKLEVEILTLFPRMCAGYLGESILGKAQEAGHVAVRVEDIRGRRGAVQRELLALEELGGGGLAGVADRGAGGGLHQSGTGFLRSETG